MSDELTQAKVRELLEYDPETGVLTWRTDRTNGRGRVIRSAGSVAGWVKADNRTSYRYITIDGRMYSAHRLAWLLVHGSWPLANIDHADGDGLNNRISNLREATRSENAGNSSRRSDNVSGVKGVCLHNGKWIAQIKVAGKNHRLGSFDSVEAAASAYKAAAVKYFGDFART